MNNKKYKEELVNQLFKLPKEVLINYIVNKPPVTFYGELACKELIIDMKIDYNLILQSRAIEDLNNHQHYEGTDRIKWLANHQEWEKLSKVCDDLFAKNDKLYEEKHNFCKDCGQRLDWSGDK